MTDKEILARLDKALEKIKGDYPIKLANLREVINTARHKFSPELNRKIDERLDKK